MEVQVDQVEIVKNKLKVIEDKNVALNQIVDGQNESIKTLISAVDEKTLEIKNLELKVINLNESVENCKEIFVTSEQVQNQLLKATQFMIENAVQAVVATFEQKQNETEKTNEARLDALLEQLSQLFNLVQTRPTDTRSSPPSSQCQLQPTGPQQITSQHSQPTSNLQLKPQQHLSRSNQISDPGKSFTCDLCGQNFEIERTLRNHTRTNHNPQKPT